MAEPDTGVAVGDPALVAVGDDTGLLVGVFDDVVLDEAVLDDGLLARAEAAGLLAGSDAEAEAVATVAARWPELQPPSTTVPSAIPATLITIGPGYLVRRPSRPRGAFVGVTRLPSFTVPIAPEFQMLGVDRGFSLASLTRGRARRP